MQPALTPEILIPVGIGALLLLVAVVVVRRLRRRRARMRPTVADAVRDAGPVGPEPGPTVPEGPAVPAGPVDGPPDRGEEPSEHGVDPADRVGSGRTVAAAVAHALAVREARGRMTVDPAPATAQTHLAGQGDAAGPWSAPGGPPADRGDARDRLLAVLLDDPVRAVGATVELEACRRQLDRLTEAVQHERDALGSVLARLADAGLAPDQLARLSGLSDDELRGLLAARVGAG